MGMRSRSKASQPRHSTGRSRKSRSWPTAGWLLRASGGDGETEALPSVQGFAAGKRLGRRACPGPAQRRRARDLGARQSRLFIAGRQAGLHQGRPPETARSVGRRKRNIIAAPSWFLRRKPSAASCWAGSSRPAKIRPAHRPRGDKRRDRLLGEPVRQPRYQVSRITGRINGRLWREVTRFRYRRRSVRIFSSITLQSVFSSPLEPSSVLMITARAPSIRSGPPSLTTKPRVRSRGRFRARRCGC